jgi:hypothetical protein
MYKRLIALFVLATASLSLSAARVTEMGSRPLAFPEEHRSVNKTMPRLATNGDAPPVADATTPAIFPIYPIAGTIGRDVVIPYFVDLDASDVRRDYNCSRATFNDHRGHDPYIRSFSEQRIGVPVFAVRDGRVISMRAGEFDEATSAANPSPSNFVTIRHDDGETTEYVHLRRDVLVSLNQRVTAGTQIGWVGSSGSSTAPHIHFEVRNAAGLPYEPMAGDCRPGLSSFTNQPHVGPREPTLYGATFSNTSFANFEAPPYDHAPHTGTFPRGVQTIYFKAELLHARADTKYQLLLQKPGSTRTETAATGTLITYDASLTSMWWGIEVNLDRTGDWLLILDVDGERVHAMPFTVVDLPSQIVNRPPHEHAAMIEPVRAGQAAVCRATSLAAWPDPDYDVVRYRYEWRAGDTVVRDVTTAAQSDALASQFVKAGTPLSCAVTVSDASRSATTVTAHTAPSTYDRRRAVRK